MPDTTNRAYKDSMFVDLFCHDRDGKKNFLSLYNALHGTSLTPETTPLKDVGIQNVLFRRQNNDVSMLVDNRIVVLCEHQSTINENMPLRCLMYLARIYEEQLDARLRFKRRLQQIPVPAFYVFYNGVEDAPESTVLHLQDAFPAVAPHTPPPVDVCVTVYNLNKPTGSALWEQCKPLTEYNVFVTIAREEQRGGGNYMERAVRRALRRGILSEYLSRKGKEVENMFFGEYDYDLDVAVQREEAFEEGEAHGIAVGIAEGEARGKRNKAFETARNYLRMGLTAEQVAQGSDIPLADVLQLQQTL